jgi:hypothetical protein
MLCCRCEPWGQAVIQEGENVSRGECEYRDGLNHEDTGPRRSSRPRKLNSNVTAQCGRSSSRLVLLKGKERIERVSIIVTNKQNTLFLCS